MKRTVLHVYFDQEETTKIRKMAASDQKWLVMKEKYDKEIEELKKKINELEEKRSRENTKATRRAQIKFMEEILREGS